MCAIAQPILMILAAELRHGVSTELLGLLGGLLRIALPGVDVINQIKLHLTIWSLPAAVMVHRISRTVHRFRP
jgi:hypothetical protein